MRLIDADKLKEELKINGLGYQYYMLDNAPTVKAIPIDELFKFIDSRVVQPDGNVKYTDDITHLQTFISEWRMDNEEGYRDEVNRWWADHSSRFD